MCTNCKVEIATHHGDDDLCDDCHDESYFTCAACGDDYNDLDDQVTAPDTGETICQSCFDANYSCCDCCDEYHADNDMTKVARQSRPRGNDMLCPMCVDAQTVECDDCGDVIYDDDSCRAGDYGTVCQRCFEDNYFTCGGCGEVWHNDNYACGGECENCYDNAGPDYAPLDCPHDGPTVEVGSGRCYGLEVETHRCANYAAFEGKTYFGAKAECTVEGKEFFSSILHGDAGLGAIDDLTKFAKANKWEVGRSCGTHLHLDLRNDTNDQRYAIAYAYLRLENTFYSFVAESRRTNSYCQPARVNAFDIAVWAEKRDYRNFVGQTVRYAWMNLYAFTHHKTIEIRSLEGSLDPTQLKNWIKLHTRFADWASKLGLTGVMKTLGSPPFSGAGSHRAETLLAEIMGYELYTYYFKPEKNDDANSNS